MMWNKSNHSLKNRNKTKEEYTHKSPMHFTANRHAVFISRNKVIEDVHICEVCLCEVRNASLIKSSLYLDVWGPRCAGAARGIGRSKTAARHLCGCLLPLQRHWGQLGVSLTYVACTREVASCTDAPSLLLWCFCLRDRNDVTEECVKKDRPSERPPFSLLPPFASLWSWNKVQVNQTGTVSWFGLTVQC